VTPDRQSTLAHEAAHVVGGLLAGHRIEMVRIGPSRKHPKDAGTTSFDLSSDIDMFGHLVAVLMGPMAEGGPAPEWPPRLDPESRDSMAVCTLVNRLALSRADFEAAVALAAHWLDDPFVKSAITTIADALGQAGELDDRQVRDALGPGLLGWFELAEPPSLLRRELCST
jgi:hypothetical protein